MSGSFSAVGVGWDRYLVVSPDGRNVYRATLGQAAGSGVFEPHDSMIASFRRSSGTGALQQLRGRWSCSSADPQSGCRTVRGMHSVGSIAISPDGLNVYGVSQTDRAVFVLRRDPGTGALRQLAVTACCVAARTNRLGCARAVGLQRGSGVIVSPDGRNLYVFGADESPSITVFRRGAADGSLTRLRGARGCLVTSAAIRGCSALKGASRYPFINGAVISPDGLFMYLMGPYRGGFGVIGRSRADGSLTAKPAVAGCLAASCDQDFLGGTLVMRSNGSALIAAGDADQPHTGLNVFGRQPMTGAIDSFAALWTCDDAPSGASPCAGTVPRALTLLAASPDDTTLILETGQRITVLGTDPATGLLGRRPEDFACYAQHAAGCARLTFDGEEGAFSPDGRSLYLNQSSSELDIIAVE
jgi:hypothetical protein